MIGDLSKPKRPLTWKDYSKREQTGTRKENSHKGPPDSLEVIQIHRQVARSAASTINIIIFFKIKALQRLIIEYQVGRSCSDHGGGFASKHADVAVPGHESLVCT